MARKSLIVKSLKKPKFANRVRSRCGMCGRPRAFYRKFGLCRLCLRKMAHEGVIPGLMKASW
jgi:small subunit ribosomal protein S14